MKRIVIALLAGVLILLIGCNSINDVTKNTTTTITEKTIYQKDGKTPISKEKITVIFEEDIKKKDEGFTLGSKGLGSYSFIHDISFM